MPYNPSKIAAELDIKEDEILAYDEENIFPLTVKTEESAKKTNKQYHPISWYNGHSKSETKKTFYFIP